MIQARRTAKGEVRYDVRYRGPDKRTRNKTFRTRRDAERFEREMRHALDRGTWIDPAAARVTLNEWAADWSRSNLHLRPKTREIYEANLALHILPTLGPIELGSLTPKILREWVVALATEPKATKAGGMLSPSYVHQQYRTLNRLLQAAVESEVLAKNPLDGVKPPRVERAEMRFLTAEQVAALADAIDQRYRVFVLLAAYCGLREGELRALRRHHINPLHRVITVVEQLDERRGGGFDVWDPKTPESMRSVPFPTFIAEELERHMEQFSEPGTRGLVFTAPNGGPIRIENWRRRVWAPALSKAKVGPLRLHDLRHTCAALAISAGADVLLIQRMFGHRSVTTTLDVYGHLLPSAVGDVADRLDSIGRAASGNGNVGDADGAERAPGEVAQLSSDALG